MKREINRSNMKQSAFVFLVVLFFCSSSNLTQKKEKVLFSQRHETTYGKIKLILHNKRKVVFGESNYVEIRGQLKEGFYARLNGNGIVVVKILGDGMYNVKPGNFLRNHDRMLELEIVNTDGEVKFLASIKMEKHINDNRSSND